VSRAEIGTKRQCTNCGAKFFDLRKSPIVCPKCGALYQVAAQKPRELFRGAARPVPETEKDSEAELVFREEVDEEEDKVAAVATDDLDVEAEAADDTLVPEEEEEVTGDISPLIDENPEPMKMAKARLMRLHGEARENAVEGPWRSSGRVRR
jgi:uncharacterized protein (TIGR02300 family)